MSRHDKYGITACINPVQRNFLQDKGFTLFEILVALAVLGIAFAAIFQLFSADLRAVNASDDYSLAVIRAESKMREILDDEDISERSWSETTEEGYRFDAAVNVSEKVRTETLPVQLLEVSLKMTWDRDGKERAITLKTMKVVNKKI